MGYPHRNYSEHFRQTRLSRDVAPIDGHEISLDGYGLGECAKASEVVRMHGYNAQPTGKGNGGRDVYGRRIQRVDCVLLGE